MKLRKVLDIPVFVVKTEHYKCNSHIPGMVRTLETLVKVMKKHDQCNGVNILGHRQEGIEHTELYKD